MYRALVPRLSAEDLAFHVAKRAAQDIAEDDWFSRNGPMLAQLARLLGRLGRSSFGAPSPRRASRLVSDANCMDRPCVAIGCEYYVFVAGP